MNLIGSPASTEPGPTTPYRDPATGGEQSYEARVAAAYQEVAQLTDHRAAGALRVHPKTDAEADPGA